MDIANPSDTQSVDSGDGKEVEEADRPFPWGLAGMALSAAGFCLMALANAPWMALFAMALLAFAPLFCAAGFGKNVRALTIFAFCLTLLPAAYVVLFFPLLLWGASSL